MIRQYYQDSEIKIGPVVLFYMGLDRAVNTLGISDPSAPNDWNMLIDSVLQVCGSIRFHAYAGIMQQFVYLHGR